MDLSKQQGWGRRKRPKWPIVYIKCKGHNYTERVRNPALPVRRRGGGVDAGVHGVAFFTPIIVGRTVVVLIAPNRSALIVTRYDEDMLRFRRGTLSAIQQTGKL